MEEISLTISEILEFVNTVGGETVVREVLSGAKKFTLLNPGTILVDQHGRVKPPQGMRVVPRADLGIIQPREFNFVHILQGVYKAFSLEDPPSNLYDTFTERLVKLRHSVETSPAVQALFKGPHFPVVLPQQDVEDYGKSVWDTFFPVLGRVMKDRFNDRAILSAVSKESVQGDITVVDGSRHVQLLERMKEGPVFGWYFPQAFWGFGVEQQRQAIQKFPAGFMLSGAADTLAAAIAHPHIFACPEARFPILDCAGVSVHEDICLSYGVTTAHLSTFCFSLRIQSQGFDNFSGGLLYIGSSN